MHKIILCFYVQRCFQKLSDKCNTRFQKSLCYFILFLCFPYLKVAKLNLFKSVTSYGFFLYIFVLENYYYFFIVMWRFIHYCERILSNVWFISQWFTHRLRMMCGSCYGWLGRRSGWCVIHASNNLDTALGSGSFVSCYSDAFITFLLIFIRKPTPLALGNCLRENRMCNTMIGSCLVYRVNFGK